MVVPNNHGFSYKKWSFWGVLGLPPFKDTPILEETETRNKLFWAQELDQLAFRRPLNS